MNKIFLRTLALLGAGTATLCVTACYGPIPQGYTDEIMDDENVDSLYEAPANNVDIDIDEAVTE